MNSLITLTIFIIFVVIVFVVLSVLSKNFTLKPQELHYPYRKRDYLLSIAERNFYSALKKFADDNNYLLFPKVRLEDLLWIPKSVSQKERFGLRQRIKSRHIDFLICDKEKVSPLLAIELDDSSHRSDEGVKKDKFINKALEDAKLPLLRFRVQSSYNPDFISKEIRTKINQ